MTLALTLNGATIVVESDDSTTITVAFSDKQAENTATFNYVPLDMFELIDGIKASMMSHEHYEPMQNDRVMHEQYGIGTVISKSRDRYYGVAFDNPTWEMHKCNCSELVWGKSGTRNNCWWVRQRDIVPVVKPTSHNIDTLFARFQRYLEDKEREMCK